MASHPLIRSIARRELKFVGLDGRKRRVAIRLGQPRRARIDWVCPFEILGMPDERRQRVFGIDPMQALGLALHAIWKELAVLAELAGGGRYWFQGEAGAFADGCELLREPPTRRALAASGISLSVIPRGGRRRNGKGAVAP